jgi:DNA-binding transcriptional ArsR family regulator
MNRRSYVDEQLTDCSVRVVDAERVRAVRGALPDPTRLGELAEMFALLADASRVRLLVALLQAPELCVCDLAAVTGSSESSVSHALRLLRASRVVTVRREGRVSYYRLLDEHVRQLLDLGLSHLGELDADLAATS